MTEEDFVYTCEEHHFYTNLPFYANEHLEKMHQRYEMCVCGHTRKWHEKFGGRLVCTRDDCPCKGFKEANP